MGLEISHSKVDAVVLVTLRGTIIAGKDTDLLTGKAQELLEAGETRIILDLAQITFIDSTGISALIKASTSAIRKGGAIKLLNLTRRIHEVLQITRLSSAFEIYDDLQKALASFGNKPEGNGSALPQGAP